MRQPTLTISTPLVQGARGELVREVQQWLVLRAPPVAPALTVDGEYGPKTTAAVAAFQRREGLVPDGLVDPVTFACLVAPLRRAQAPIADTRDLRLRDAVVLVAEQWADEKPRELPGNAGPWVRATCHHENVPWCAGFVSTVLEQACASLGATPPVPRTLSCDGLASSAQRRGLLVPGGTRGPRPGWLYLVRGRTPGDWVHTGIVIEHVQGSRIVEISGNTSEGGSREGVAVLRRVRPTAGLDYIEVT